MLTSLVSLQQRNVKKSEKLMKIDNIEGENLHVFCLMNFPGKTWLMIKLKVKKSRVSPSLERAFLEKPKKGDK